MGARCPNSGATWAPVFITHGGNNRTMMIRVPAAGRFEYRTADSSANPYLAATGILAAGLDGIEKGCNPAHDARSTCSRCRGSRLWMRHRLAAVNLGEALDELERDDVLCDALGQTTPKLLENQTCRVE
jgi:glutamine synthetase